MGSHQMFPLNHIRTQNGVNAQQFNLASLPLYYRTVPEVEGFSSFLHKSKRNSRKKRGTPRILAALSQRYGREFVDYVYDVKTQQVRGFLQFLVNGKSASILDGLQTELRDGDVLAILPPVGGG
jgi:molybdopterin converting factor small subunit